jgi:hypothetical protein
MVVVLVAGFDVFSWALDLFCALNVPSLPVMDGGMDAWFGEKIPPDGVADIGRILDGVSSSIGAGLEPTEAIGVEYS